MAEEEAKPGTWVRDTPTAMSKAQVTAGLVATGLLVLAGLHTLGDFLPALVWAVVIS